MNEPKRTFTFATSTTRTSSREIFALELPANIGTEDALFSYYGQAGRFPSYFGRNWDALLDCLRDFSWVEQKQISIIHKDVPLAKDERKARVYLEILATAVRDWRSMKPGASSDPPAGWNFVPHALSVVFPRSAEPLISRLLEGVR